MRRNLKIGWKIGILAAMIPVASIVIGMVAVSGIGKLKAEFDNLYGYMLIPIMAVDKANVDSQILDRSLQELNRGESTGSMVDVLKEVINTKDAAMVAVVNRYEQEWLTTLSPEFTGTLISLGKSALQQQEAKALENFHVAYRNYAPKRDSILEGETVDIKSLQTDLGRIHKAFDDLVAVNQAFANISDENAQKAISKVRIQMLVSAIVISGVGLVLGWLLARIIVRPVIQLTRVTTELQTGNLDVQLPDQTSDEIGMMSAAFSGLIEYLHELTTAAERLAQGDLTSSVRPKSEKDILGNAFWFMVENLRGLVGQIHENAAGLRESAGDLSNTATQAGQVVGQISTSMQQVSGGISQQAESVNRTAQATEELRRFIDQVAQGARDQATSVGKASSVTVGLSRVIHQVARNAEKVMGGSADAREAARQGEVTVNQTIQRMGNIQEKVQRSAEKVQDMGKRSQQIGIIVETIEDIASQTNLLALNAAIEAARAGEHGKGFAVVADEVRKLAERAASSTREISALIKEIQRTVADAVDAMQDGSREVEQGVTQGGVAGEALTLIVRLAEEVYTQAEEASEATKSMNKSAGELVSAVDSVSEVVEQNTLITQQMTSSAVDVMAHVENIASVSEENSASIEEVSAGAEEMSAQVEEVTTETQLLAGMAQELESLVAQFSLETQPAEPAGELVS